jgi:hypothetical protein
MRNGSTSAANMPAASTSSSVSSDTPVGSWAMAVSVTTSRPRIADRRTSVSVMPEIVDDEPSGRCSSPRAHAPVTCRDTRRENWTVAPNGAESRFSASMSRRSASLKR